VFHSVQTQTPGLTCVMGLMCRLSKLQKHMGLSAHLTFTYSRRCTLVHEIYRHDRLFLDDISHIKMGRFCDLPYKNLSPSELAGVFLIEHHIILQKKFSED
jgi:hypothetical protein